MSTVLPRRLVVTAEAKPGLMHERGGLQRLARRFIPHLVRGELPQLVVNQRQQLLRRSWITRFNLAEDLGDIVHIGSSIGIEFSLHYTSNIPLNLLPHSFVGSSTRSGSQLDATASHEWSLSLL